MGFCPTSQRVEKLRDGPLGIHVQTMENRRTLSRLLSHMLPFLPVPYGKASGCCRARRGSRWQTRKEVRNQVPFRVQTRTIRIRPWGTALVRYVQSHKRLFAILHPRRKTGGDE